MTIKIKIKSVREEKGISLRKLEEETGIKRKYLSDVEENKIPADKILFVEIVLIGEALGCSIEDLFEVGHIEIKGIGKF
jgi:transcriptional regulator with XRE-family HTH domain|nr:MAG TPA: Helix-turn-helix XRE-family like protein [Caudoviricetes sp.]